MYELNKLKFISERFDEETVLVDVENGFYYSISDSGTQILDLLESGCSSNEIAQALAGDSNDQADTAVMVANFVDQLKTESIVIPRRGGSSSERTATTGSRRVQPAVALALQPPTLTRYEDMRDILLLDPVHLVDQEFGWPRR